MNNDLTRKYNLPTPVSNSTASLLEQYKQNINHSPTNNNNSTNDNNSITSSSTSGNNNHISTSKKSFNIPDVQDLLTIKVDMEALLPLTENRVKDLKKDLNYLDRNVRIRDNGGGKNLFCKLSI
jgi:hypothetical protein